MAILTVHVTPRAAVLLNDLVKQIKWVEFDLYGIHLVAAGLENSISTVLSSRNLGKFVPVIVRLSAPRTFKKLSGWISVTVQLT
jgi:hypothetical protein